jgi:phosphate acetyltransferase
MSLLDLAGWKGLVVQLGYLVEAQGAGTILGARIPIILTSRAATLLARIAPCGICSHRRGP